MQIDMYSHGAALAHVAQAWWNPARLINHLKALPLQGHLVMKSTKGGSQPEIVLKMRS